MQDIGLPYKKMNLKCFEVYINQKEVNRSEKNCFATFIKISPILCSHGTFPQGPDIRYLT